MMMQRRPCWLSSWAEPDTMLSFRTGRWKERARLYQLWPRIIIEEEPQGRLMKRKLLGKYIVADPEVCHGQPTFLGTRVRVSQVLKAVAEGMDWGTIVWQWRGTVCREAIEEAIRLASRAFTGQKYTRSRKSKSA
jgi:uncharacterized protein (DUF433 family)